MVLRHLSYEMREGRVFEERRIWWKRAGALELMSWA